MKLELVTRTDVSYVELQKDDKHVLGISVRDGTQDEAGPVVKCVKQKSPAAKSFAVAKGDIILSVNGISATGINSKEIGRMLKEAGSAVDFQLQYRTQETRIPGSGVYRKQQMTTRLRKINDSFGFVLRKKDSKYYYAMEYPIVSNIKEGSQVHKNGQLQEGDHLLMIDDVSVSWMSLPSIASLLQEKDEAEFTFEYNVRVVNFVEEEVTLDLEIDVPIADLGISICTSDEECTAMYISSIRQGSVVERCGVFSEGDVILSINDIDSKDLTVTKADTLLQKAEPGRKISYITSGQKEEIAETLKENSSCSTEVDSITSESCYSSGSQSSEWKLLNSPASSNFASSVQQKYIFQTFYYCEQFNAMDNFHIMVSQMTSLKQNLSTLTHEAFGEKQNMPNQNCTSCNNTEHKVKLCVSCLAGINVKCAESMDALRNLVAQFVRFSADGFYEKEHRILGISVRNIVYTLKETLPNFFRVPELQEHFTILAEKIASADSSCSTCELEVKSVMIIVQQLLLVLSVRDNSVEFIDLIEQLVSRLLRIKFTCDGETETMHSSTGGPCNTSLSENSSCSASVSISIGEFSSGSRISHIKNNSEADSSGIYNSIESNLNNPQLNTRVNYDYLKFAHIQSRSESRSSVAVQTPSVSNAHSAIRIENSPTSLEENIIENSSTSSVSDNSVNTNVKKIRRDIGLKLGKVWRSVDSLIRPRRPAGVENITQNACHPTSDKHETSDSSEVNHAISSKSLKTCHSRLPPNHNIVQNGEIVSDTASSSSTCPPEDRSSTEIKKTRTETMKVKMTNDGDGFGLGISYSDNSTSTIPVINSIQPKSPSHKSGILKLGDRILAINNKSTSSLTPRQLHNLKKKVFTADTITLIVEFDVVDEEYKFGTFDVVLDRTLKIGLIFEDMKKGSPMVVTGIAKGSGAHRCGQLFPRDELKFFRSTRIEEFDPMSCNYNREENVIITVQRDPRKVLSARKKSANPSPSYVNPCFHQEDTVPRSGVNFVVKKTAVRALERMDALVLDHEVTLYRDSSKFDFGFLVGENPRTGRAYITDIRPGGPADKAGVIKKLDRIVEVNGVLVDRNSVVELLSQANNEVDLLIRRIYHEELNEI